MSNYAPGKRAPLPTNHADRVKYYKSLVDDGEPLFPDRTDEPLNLPPGEPGPDPIELALEFIHRWPGCTLLGLATYLDRKVTPTYNLIRPLIESGVVRIKTTHGKSIRGDRCQLWKGHQP